MNPKEKANNKPNTISATKLGNKLLAQLYLKSEEYITTDGLRFSGVSFEKIKQVFKSNGIEFIAPF